MKNLKLIAVILLALFLTSCFNDSPARMRGMMRQVPEAIEMFEQSREHLEVLRTGGFAERELWVFENLVIHFGTTEGGGGVRYENWYTLEWLSEEERDALVFLLTSEELSRNFVVIESTREAGSIVAALHWQRAGHVRGEFIEIWHGEHEVLRRRINPMRDSYSRDLGDGWVLWVYTTR